MSVSCVLCVLRTKRACMRVHMHDVLLMTVLCMLRMLCVLCLLDVLCTMYALRRRGVCLGSTPGSKGIEYRRKFWAVRQCT